MTLLRFGREGNLYWRGILLFQCKFLNAEAGPFGRNIAAGLVKAGISTMHVVDHANGEKSHRLATEFNCVASAIE
jgi:hypothetical protein